MADTDPTVAAQAEVDAILNRAKASSAKFATYTQEQILDHRIELAQMAIEEGRMGTMEDKTLKNHIVVEYIHNHYRESKTVGVIEEDEVTGLIKVAEPLGVIAGIVPCTSPSAEVFFYILLALKSRNVMVIAAHPRTNKTSNYSAELMYKYALEAGAPEDCIIWIPESSIIKSGLLMEHPEVDLILATGGAGLVRAAYSSGTPALGVGAGNVPAIMHGTADMRRAMADIFISKLFDNGTACTSEQLIVAKEGDYERMKVAFLERGGYILTGDDAKKMTEIIIVDGQLNRQIVGQDVQCLAALAGISVPQTALLLGCEISGEITLDNPWCWEKLSPLIALYESESDEHSVEVAHDMVAIAGNGHSAVIHVDEDTESGKATLMRFMERVSTSQFSINAPNTSITIGNQYNFHNPPSMMMGCGSWGHTSHAGPVELDQFLNIKVAVRRRHDMLWFKVPRKIYFRSGSINFALQDLKGKRRRAFIVTDRPIVQMGYLQVLIDALDSIGMAYDVFDEVEPDPSAGTILKGVERIKHSKPDTIIGFGGGSPMDAAKVMRLLYEKPDVDIYATTVRFLHPRRRVYQYPSLDDAKTIMVCIPTTSGTGSEITPFAVVTSPKDGRKYATGDYELTPDMAILDPQFVMSLPPKVAAYTGMDALSHAIESLVSVQSNEFNRGIAMEAIRLMFKYLPVSVQEGDNPKIRKAREKMHYAASMAAMSVAQVLVGVTHSCAHALGAYFHLPHGLCIGFFLSISIRFNSNPVATRQTGSSFLQHTHKAASRYARVARYLGLKGETVEELVDALIAETDKISEAALIPKCIGDLGISRADFDAKLDKMVLAAFDDQCTLTNPRVPQMNEIRAMFIAAYEGTPYDL